VFVYQKTDDHAAAAAKLDILHTVFIERARTGDFQTTLGLKKILENEGNEDDLVAFMQERMLPIDDIGAARLAQEILRKPPQIGYLTISNALQWRLQHKRVIGVAGTVKGIIRIR